VAGVVVAHIAQTMEIESDARPRPSLDSRFLLPYDEPRWAPVR
jgi:hypothetical protein